MWINNSASLPLYAYSNLYLMVDNVIKLINSLSIYKFNVFKSSFFTHFLHILLHLLHIYTFYFIFYTYLIYLHICNLLNAWLEIACIYCICNSKYIDKPKWNLYLSLKLKFLISNIMSKFIQKLCEVTESCPSLCDPMDHSLPGSSIHGIFQARVLEWVAILFSRGSSQPRDWNCIAGICFTIWATREALFIHK